MELLNGFSDPITDAQNTFRLILQAMSEPGQVATLTHGPAWLPLSSASCAVLLTLADHDTPLYLAASLRGERLNHNLRFHTGAPLTDHPAQAELALLGPEFPAILLNKFACGNNESPHKSTTVIIEAASFNGGPALRLSGPGIRHRRVITPALPEGVRRYLLQRPTPFPQGLDFIFTCGRQLLAIPRTTHVEVD